MKRWTIVLIEPKEGGNVGAAARVLKNFGLSELRVVSPRCEVNGDDARRFSSGAAELLRSAKSFESLREAVADQQLVIGLTGVSGRQHRLDCTQMIPTNLLEGKNDYTKCALVFGREDRGMYSEDMEACDFLWSLPTVKEFSSLNLAQAIGIAIACLTEAENQAYERHDRRGLAPSEKSLNPLAGSEHPEDVPANAASVERLCGRLEELLKATDSPGEVRMKSNIARVRNLLKRGNATEREVAFLQGLVKQCLYKIE